MSEVFQYEVTYALPEPDDSNCLTPRQRREMEEMFIKAITDAADRQLFNILTGGYDVNRADNRGRTLDHVPRKKLLTNQRETP